MKITSEEEMLAFGKEFAKELKSNVIELIGDVGAGKTTFTRGLAMGLGIKEPITSPSFTISKAYALKNGGNLIHYDFYRLGDPGIMQDNLKEKTKDKNNIIVIEWGESIKTILPSHHTIISIQKKNDGTREIIVDNNRNNTFRDHPRPTGSGTSEVPPVTTGGHERVEKGVIRLYLDTSSPTTILKLNNKVYEWDSGHDLAEKLLQFMKDKLEENGKSFNDIAEITFVSGPGSFTGLRIGASVVNTLAHELNIPLYDHHGEKHKIILPDYGRGASITSPKK